jgi:primosomal protein N' (replication factor Y) (superfamily II helicase)
MYIPKKSIAEIVLPLPVNKTFHYFIPEKLNDEIEIGKRVLVSLGQKNVIGYVVNFVAESEQKNLKNILKVIDREPLLSEELLKLAYWLADYYLCSRGEAIQTAVPFKLKGEKTALSKTGESVPGPVSLSVPFIPTPEQQKGLCSIKNNLDRREFKVFLVHGVGGSGKTELYLKSIDHALSLDRQVIFLVPEISLIEDNLNKLQSRFPKQSIIVFHSHMSDTQKYEAWVRIKRSEANIIIGTRSAIFAPFSRLGLIIAEDEEDSSYKQEQKPMYRTKEVASKRAEFNHAVLILGSSTPSVESYWRAGTGRYELISLPRVINGTPLPAVKIVDIKDEILRKSRGPFYKKLKDGLAQRLEKNEQAIIFSNRRGWANFIICEKCGLVLKCPSCDVSLSYHNDVNQLQCHYCGYKQQLEAKNNLCPGCHQPLTGYLGKGTQKLESQLLKLFPGIKTMRLDLDVIKKEPLKSLINKFNRGQADVLIATQVVLKSPLMPKVSLLGVVLADTVLNVPNFHSAEQAYALFIRLINLVQKAGLAAEVVIQTYNPSHYVLTAVKEENPGIFYRQELDFRKELNYPPFSHLVNIIIKGNQEKKVASITSELGEAFRQEISRSKLNVSILGPAPAPFLKLRGLYRWQIILKSENDVVLRGVVKQVMDKRKIPRGFRISLDMDPLEIS